MPAAERLRVLAIALEHRTFEHKLDEPELLRRTRVQVTRLGLQNRHQGLFEE